MTDHAPSPRSTCLLVAWLAGAAACGRPAPACVEPSLSGELRAANVVVVMMDDVGVDRIAAYGVHPQPASTPRLDALAADGALFLDAFAEPVCSPGRAALLTGRRPLRTGLGTTIDPQDRFGELDAGEHTLPEVLRDHAPERWTSVAIGKWHLALFDPGAFDAAQRQGFDHFDGLVGNPGTSVRPIAGSRGYYRWEHVVDGAAAVDDRYAVSVQGDAAVEAIQALPEPFLLYVAFSGAHEPLEPPPSRDPLDPDASEPRLADATIAWVDAQIGRIADALGDRGVLLVTSDNGTSGRATRPPSRPDRQKGTLYQGGTQVPLVVWGPGIASARLAGVVHLTDVFHTVLDLAGVPRDALSWPTDGTSLVPRLVGSEEPVRRCVVVEQFARNDRPNRHYEIGVIDDGYALLRHPPLGDELFRRRPGAVDDGPNLLKSPLDAEASAALRRLRAYRRAAR